MIHIRFWRLPAPPARLPRIVRVVWLALSLWRGWPARVGDGRAYDPFADIGVLEAWRIARAFEV